jgi:hypothetical protein
MKNLILLLVAGLLSSCSPEDATPTTPVMDPFDPIDAMLLKEGMFMGTSGHPVSGAAKIYDDMGEHVVQFENFSSINGPDLKVYLSTDINASDFISLGALKSTTGMQSYEISGTPDYSKYKFVLIWCQQFSVLFGSAEVK